MGDRNSINSLNGGGDDEMGSFGVNNLEAKQQKVAEYYENNFTSENMDELGTAVRKLFREDIPVAAKGALNSAVKSMTPGFIQRFQNKKIYAQEVVDKERYVSTIILIALCCTALTKLV